MEISEGDVLQSEALLHGPVSMFVDKLKYWFETHKPEKSEIPETILPKRRKKAK